MTNKLPPLKGNIDDLLIIIHALRGPDGCLWDKKQTRPDIGRYLIEEAYEVVDAIADGDKDHLKEELGDLLFQILFLTVLAEEAKEYSLQDIIFHVAEKMIRRHPHVFADVSVQNVEDIKNNWAYIKEHIEKKPVRNAGFLGKYPLSMPALTRAQKITEQASKIGFDWENSQGVLEKIDEEIAELKEAVLQGQDERIADEIGDLLFSVVNLCRFMDVDAETNLKKTTDKFAGRFAYIEKSLANQQKTLLESTPAEMNRLWDEAKELEEKTG